MQFEYEPEQLIEEVKKRPCIWDHEHPDFRSKHTKTKSWNQIVKELMTTDLTMELSKSDLRELEIQLQKKWKSIRDCFQKSLLNAKTKKPYIYSKQLHFLMKDKKLPERKKYLIQVGSSDDSDEDKHKQMTSWKLKKKLRIGGNDYESDHNNEDIITGDHSYTYEDITTETKVKPNETIEEIDQFAFVDAQPKNDIQPRNEYKIDYEDTDKMFLLSLLPHLKSIPEQFRLNVKVELMNVLRTAHDNTRKFGRSNT